MIMYEVLYKISEDCCIKTLTFMTKTQLLSVSKYFEISNQCIFSFEYHFGDFIKMKKNHSTFGI